jgi:hypothetical protein
MTGWPDLRRSCVNCSQENPKIRFFHLKFAFELTKSHWLEIVPLLQNTSLLCEDPTESRKILGMVVWMSKIIYSA